MLVLRNVPMARTFRAARFPVLVGSARSTARLRSALLPFPPPVPLPVTSPVMVRVCWAVALSQLLRPAPLTLKLSEAMRQWLTIRRHVLVSVLMLAYVEVSLALPRFLKSMAIAWLAPQARVTWSLRLSAEVVLLSAQQLF